MGHAMGVTVFAGMLGVTFFGLFLTPVFYRLIRRLTARSEARHKPGNHAIGHAEVHGA